MRKVVKKMEITKKKRIVSLPTDKMNKSIYILVDGMVKHLEIWKLKKFINKDHNVYIRGFSEAKVNCMKDYVESCICGKNPGNVILYVEINELNYDLPPERIAKHQCC